jgi:gamma-glutamyl-gamma-aminobutyrate hydrolase PuuD
MGAPLILVAPSTERAGAEFADWSVSLSNRYTDAIIAAGGVPVILPATTGRGVIAEAVRRCDGVLMTGGDDINPKLYAKKLPKDLAKTTGTHDAARDVWETILIEEIFRQGKPMLGICRGQQILNVALGGTLVVDIPTQVPNAIKHNQMAKKTKPVHDTCVTPDSLLAKITGARNLRVNSTHHQSVGRLGKGLRVVAQSEDGVIEALELEDAARLPFLLTVQFHPERMIDGKGIFLRLFSSFTSACGRQNKS